MPIDPTRRAALLPMPTDPVRPMFRTLGISASGLSAQSRRLETIAQNIANAGVTRGADGTPYKRQDVVMQSATADNAMYPGPSILTTTAPGTTNVAGMMPPQVPTTDGPLTIEVPVLTASGSGTPGSSDGGQWGVRVVGIAQDQGEGKLTYEPGHPDADANGYVRYPNVSTTQEMVNMLDAKRMYEANASVFATTKSMLRASLDI